MFTSPRVIPISLAKHKVGVSILHVKVCQTVRCAEREISIPLVAGAMTNIQIITPSDKAISNTQIPFVVLGYDSYGNPIEQ